MTCQVSDFDSSPATSFEMVSKMTRSVECRSPIASMDFPPDILYGSARRLRAQWWLPDVVVRSTRPIVIELISR